MAYKYNAFTGVLDITAPFGSGPGGSITLQDAYDNSTTPVTLDLTTTGDLNVRSSAASSLFFVDESTGNVGIGTTTPSNLLELSGTSNPGIIITQTDNSNAYLQFNDSDEGWDWTIESNRSSKRLDFISNTSTNASLLSTGELGIGTTAPTAKLQVVGTSDQVQQIIRANATQTADIFQIQDSSGNADILYINPTEGVVIGTRDSAGTNGGLQVSNGISIGSASAAPGSVAVLDLVEQRTVSSSVRAYRNLFNVTPTVSGLSFTGIESVVRDPANNTTNMGNLFGINTSATVQGAQTTTNAYGINATTNVTNSSGVISNAFGINVTSNNTGTIGSFRGINISQPSGSVTNATGLYLGDMSIGGSSNYAIYTNAGDVIFNANNDASSSVGIGTTVPDGALDVAGGSTTRYAYLPVGTAAPGDATLDTDQMVAWVDESVGTEKLNFKVKLSSGTVMSASINLT